MRTFFLCLTALLVITASVRGQIYYTLDNKTSASSDEIFNDPFLALRTKTTGCETPFSLADAWENLDNFTCVEWIGKNDQILEEELCCCYNVNIVNKSDVFDHTSPVFEIETDALATKIHWQISGKSDFSTVHSNFNEIIPFTNTIHISSINETFLNPDETYYFRSRVYCPQGWSDWSHTFTFRLLRPAQPYSLKCVHLESGKFHLSWEGENDPSVQYLIYGSDSSAYIPSIYDENGIMPLLVTSETSVVVDDSNCYFRVIAIRNDYHSIPSTLAVGEDIGSLLEEIQPIFGTPVLGYPYNHKVPQDIWNALSPYFLPYDHPARHKLDKIFHAKKRVLEDLGSLKSAGFRHPKPRQWTRLIVTTHKNLEGYVVKLYTDKQHPHRQRPEYTFWVSRIKGAELIRQTINDRNLNHLFKVPKKWIYPVPAHPGPKDAHYRKNFILVEEDMNILDDPANEARWRSNHVTADLLTVLHAILQDLGLWDCAKPANIPFGRDGRIAFIDTQTYHTWPVKMDRLMPFLSPAMQAHWQVLNPPRH